MAFEPIDELFDSSLKLPIGGKTYRVPSPTADVGLHCQLVAEIGRKQRAGLEVSQADLDMLTLDDEAEQQWHRRILGPALDEMVADGVGWERVKHASSTTFTWIVAGTAAAERVWAGGARAEARPPAQDHLPPASK